MKRAVITAANLFAALYRVDGCAPDLRHVRVHHSGVDDLCRGLGALAFTAGPDIFVRSDCFAPHTPAGLWLLAHEAAHVIQQVPSCTGAARPSRKIAVGPPGGLHEWEADAAANAVLAGRPFAFRPGASPWGLLRYMAWEHMLLGQLSPAKLRAAIAGDGSPGGDFRPLAAQYTLLDRLGRSPQVSQEQLRTEYPELATVRLAGSGLVVTLGELNILPDYLSHPTQIDTAPASYMVPLVQAVRAANCRQLQRLMGQPDPPRLQWCQLRYPNRRVFSEIREAIEVDALGRRCGRPAWELYSSVVSRNAGHFAPFSWYRWQAFHLEARELIKRSAAASGDERAHLRRTAQIYAGYADHFLQDSFAAGHLINKTLVMQWYIEWLLKSRLPLADRALLAAMTCQRQPVLHGPDLYHPKPGEDGQRMYPEGNTCPLPVTDPQTAAEYAALADRVEASGVIGASPQERQARYLSYLALQNSGLAQLAASLAHAYFNRNSLVTANRAGGSRYQLWGDRTLFFGEMAAVSAATAAGASRQAISDLLTLGHTEIGSSQIFESFPSRVETGGLLQSLPEWHETTLRELCFHTLFRSADTQAKRFLIAFTSRRIGMPSEDYPQLRGWLTAS